ncbi:hypothetical protein L8S62_00555 [Enterobacter cloacae]|nr:hypothetical protein [Enterobacter cloacae]MCK6740936.1 hypothetical protein [Enterobacter cloacae]MCK6780941.1 hypothetical protein [Enterobacter cloacae]
MSQVKQTIQNMALAVDSILSDVVRAALNPVANMPGLVMTARFFIQSLELSGISEQKEPPNEQHRQTESSRSKSGR